MTRSLVITLLAVGLCGCQDLSRFSTKDGDAYCGSIVTAAFIRSGFDQTLRIEMTLDADALQTEPGTLSSNHATEDNNPCAPLPLFDAAPLRVTDELQNDPLSMLHFGDGRERNFMTWVDSTCRGSFLAVVSLMKNDEVELRLLAPGSADDGAPSPPAFALFPLEKQKDGCGF